MPKAKPTNFNKTVSPTEIAEVFGRSVRWVHMLRQDGWIAPEARGQYRLGATIKGVLRYFEGLADKSDQDGGARVSEARTREIEQRIAMRETELIHRDDVAQVVNDLTDTVISAMDDLADRHNLAGEDRLGSLQSEAKAAIMTIDRARRRALDNMYGDGARSAP